MKPGPTLRGVGAFLLGFGVLVSAAAAPLRSLVGPEAQLFARVNELRRAHHLVPLQGNAALAEVARAHATDMALHRYLSHVNARGEDPLARVRAAGIEGFRLLAENIAASSAGGDRLAAILEEWLRSTSHRENLLNPAFNTSGIALVEDGRGQTLVVQLFATF